MTHPFHKTAWLSVLATAIAASTVQAAEWTFDPTVKLRTGYNDNIRLTDAPHDSVWETDLTPSARFGVETENKGLFGTARASIRRFSGGGGREISEVLDREDYHFDILSHYRTELDSWNLFLNTTRDSTLDTELDETGQVISNRATRTRYRLGPSWSHRLTELTTLNLGYTYTKVDYSDEPTGTRLVEYDYDVYSASLSHQFTPKVQATLASSYSVYKPDTGFDSDTASIQVGISRSFSETLSTSWLAGIRQTKTDRVIPTGVCLPPGGVFPFCTGGIPIQTGTINEEDKNNGTVYSVNVTKLLETGRVALNLSRSSSPSGTGNLLDSTRLRLTGQHRLTEKLDATITLEWFNTESIVSTSGNLNQTDRDTFRARPKLTWRWRREWEIGAQYEYARSENNAADSDTATRNAFYLSLSYWPTGYSISR